MHGAALLPHHAAHRGRPVPRERGSASPDGKGPLPTQPHLESRAVAQVLAEIVASHPEGLFQAEPADWENMRPADVHFTHDSVGSTFRHGPFAGRAVRDVANDIATGRLSPKQFPLRVVRFRNQFWTLNNRSLYALRIADDILGTSISARVAAYPLCPYTAKFTLAFSCEANQPDH